MSDLELIHFIDIHMDIEAVSPDPGYLIIEIDFEISIVEIQGGDIGLVFASTEVLLIFILVKDLTRQDIQPLIQRLNGKYRLALPRNGAHPILRAFDDT